MKRGGQVGAELPGQCEWELPGQFSGIFQQVLVLEQTKLEKLYVGVKKRLN